MSKQTQKDAVYNAVVNALTEAGIKVEGNVQPLMTRELRAQVNSILFEGFKSENISVEKAYGTDAELKAYISGLQSNWLRKDKRLNGGMQYVAKNPGSRAGSGDAQLKNLRALRSTLTSTEDIAEVDAHIATRVAALQTTKVKAKSIDFTVLPSELAEKFSK